MRNRHFAALKATSKLRATILGIGLAGLGLLLVIALSTAEAAVSLPQSNPVVNENECMTGTTSWRIEEASPSLGGFTTKTSVDVGESVVLKVGRDGPVSPTRTVNVRVYRMGYYGNLGGRLVDSANNVAIDNDFTCEAMDQTTGEVSCANWQPTYTIPGSALTDSGVYLVKLTASTGDETQVVFTVRDDARQPQAEVLFVLPIATYEAYNVFGGKSLYYGTEGGNTVSGTGRARQGLLRPPVQPRRRRTRLVPRARLRNALVAGEPGLRRLLHRRRQRPAEPPAAAQPPDRRRPRPLRVLVAAQLNAFVAAREAGVNIASFSANTAYWKVRYEDGGRTLVCYKTVEGSGSTGSGSVSANDWGPDGIKGTADDAVGADGIAGTADDNPQNSTTTWRDNGAPPGDPNAPPEGRVGPDRPENELFGIMYVGDNDARGFPVEIPPGNEAGEFAANSFWRNTGISENSTTSIGSMLVNWEWDAVPTQAQYLSHEPPGVERLYATNVQTANDNSWLQDEGRLRSTSPPPGQPGTIGAVKYTAHSGAEVFAAGTIQWARGLEAEADPRIQQATYNVLSEMGVQPETPSGDHPRPGRVQPRAQRRLHDLPEPLENRDAGHLRRLLLQRSRRRNRRLRMGPQRRRDLRDRHRHHRQRHPQLRRRGQLRRAPAGDRQRRRHRPRGEHADRDRQPAADRELQLQPRNRHQERTDVLRRRAPRATPTGRSPNTNGTSTATAATRPTAAPARRSNTPTKNRAPTPSACGSPTTAARRRRRRARSASSAAKSASTATRSSPRPGLANYWRMGETTGPTFSDSAGSSPATAIGAPEFGMPGGVPEDPGPRRRLQRRRLGERQPRPLGNPHRHRRVLAQVERIRQRRPPGDGVHEQLQRTGRRLPRRSQRAAARRHLRRRHRHRDDPQQRLLRTAERRRLAPLRLRPQHRRARQRTDRPLRRRQSGRLRKARHRDRRRQLRQLDAVHDVPRRSHACSAPATSTRSPSTTGR